MLYRGRNPKPETPGKETQSLNPKQQEKLFNRKKILSRSRLTRRNHLVKKIGWSFHNESIITDQMCFGHEHLYSSVCVQCVLKGGF